jgi:flavin-dependent dehydrogenase
LQRPEPINVQFGFAPAENGGSFWIFEYEEGGDSAGCGIGQDDSPEARAELADWLQEQFFAENRGAWGEARPECPSHSHPAVPKELDGEAWWVCPVDGHGVGQIGGLGR